MTLAVRTEGLSKTYQLGFALRRSVRALQGLSLSIETGQVYGLLGPNGAGKSTTIKILLNLIKPTSGKAEIFGAAPQSPEVRRSIGFLPENPAPYEYLSGVEFVTYAAKLAGLSGAALRTRVDKVLDRVGLSRAGKLQIRRYSKGMVQRVSLAQALVAEPKLLVLDEPTSGLDVLGRQLIRDIIQEQRARGTTILFCSHIIPDVEALCDRVAVIIGGNLTKEGRVDELLARQDSAMEATIEGIAEAALEPVKASLQEVRVMGPRLLVRFPNEKQREVLQRVLETGGTITRLERTRFTLEELFLKTVKESKTLVGSDLT